MKYLAGILLLSVTVFGATSWYTFGTDGRDGYDGSSGYDGRNGPTVEVKATGQSEQLNLQGSDGGNGDNGSYGEDAYSCYHNEPSYDVVGAEGGDGGDGGRAGYGGNGGGIRVYYKDIADVKKILVDSTPGRAGYPGDGNRGGNGCRCNNYSWRNKVCHNEEYEREICTPRGCRKGEEGCSCRTEKYYEEVCKWETFNCSDGPSGRDGSTGSRGRDGSFGSIELVNRLEELEEDYPSLELPIESVLSQDSTLTRHEWKELQGAVTLFAGGSRIRNDYQKYSGKTIKTVSFNWLDKKRGPDYFRGERIDISLTGFPAAVDVDFPYGILVDSNIVTNGDHTNVMVNRLMRQSELTQIRVEEMTGANEDLTLVLIDDAKVSDIAVTKILIDSGWDLEGGGEYKTWVPQDLIRSEEGKIYVNLGRLPGVKKSKIKKYFGDKCEFEMEVTREFRGASLRVERDGGNVFDIEKDVKNNKPIQVKMERE